MNNFRILSINVLAPESLLFFWRSSYGLSTDQYKSNQSYDEVNFNRIDQFLNYINRYLPDIICLQEVSDRDYDYLNFNGLNQTIQNYIAKQLDYTVISQSFTNSIFQYNYPPIEQTRKFSVNLGVATLIKNNSQVKFLRNISTANLFGQSQIFKLGDGSPFTLDAFKIGKYIFNIVNVHIKMHNYHIGKSCEEVFLRLNHDLENNYGWSKTIIVGDFNAHTSLCSAELKNSHLCSQMTDLTSHINIDSKILIGYNYQKHGFQVNYWIAKDLPILIQNVNQSLPMMSDLWQFPETQYCLSETNNQLIGNNLATADHYPMFINVDVT